MGFTKAFSDILEKYHCRGLILPLFLAVFFLSALVRSDAILNPDMPTSIISSSTKIEENKAKPEKITTPEKPSIDIAKAKAGKSSIVLASAVTQVTQNRSSATTTNSSFVTISGGTSPIFFVDPNVSAFPESGYKVGLYRNKFLYGHRHSSIFGRLASLQPGNIITITINGIPTNYVVTAKESDVPRDVASAERARYYNGISSSQAPYYQGLPGASSAHAYALMTCAGQSLGGGEATHRTIVFIDKA